MDNNKKLFEGLLKADGIDPAGATESERIAFGKMLDQQSKSKQSKPGIARPDIWRIIMKSRITKLAAAAVILITVLVSISLLDRTVAPAWAIEDTIKALENIHSVKILGSVQAIGENGESVEGNFVLLAKPNAEGTESKELHIEAPGQTTVVSPSGTTFTYHPKQNTVSVTENTEIKPKIDPWIGSKFFQEVRKFTENWKISYGKDEETGKNSIFATCIYASKSKSWWFQFDSETKLPVRFKQWTNVSFDGEPEFYAENIEYNPELPEGIFEFKIPEGAKVTHVPAKLPQYLDDPNCGISAEGLTDEEACLTIIEDYWRAIIDGDWEYLAQLRPICNSEKWELRYKQNENWPTEILEIGKPSQEESCNTSPIVPCTVKYSNGQIKNIKMIVKIRTIDGNKSCVIAGTYGGIKDFER